MKKEVSRLSVKESVMRLVDGTFRVPPGNHARMNSRKWSVTPVGSPSNSALASSRARTLPSHTYFCEGTQALSLCPSSHSLACLEVERFIEDSGDRDPSLHIAACHAALRQLFGDDGPQGGGKIAFDR